METQSVTPGKVIDNYKKAYSEFIELASHDLDAPLRKLSFLVERVTSKYNNVQDDDEIQTYVNKIEICLADMRSLVDSLAKLFRITADLIEYIPCDIETLAQDVFRGLQQLEKEDPATITFSSLPVLEADVLQYRLLFKNLFENSIRFKKKGIPVKIQISSELLNDKEKRFWSLQENKNYYKIDISDNGIGFKQENAEKIFHPFVRLHGKSQFPGNGIGLAICRKIMDIHEGIIYAEGRENEGARFILILPESH